ncbi:MAG: hypothetical protein ACK4GR_01820 [bacterium]
MHFQKCIIFYNSINVNYDTIKRFYQEIKKFFKCLTPVDITNKRNLVLIKTNIEKLGINEKALIINLGGDGSLFSSLSFLASLLDIYQIFTISFNFGNKGFYCFYDKQILFKFMEGEFNLIETIEKDYQENNYLTGSFWIVNDEFYFVGDTVIKSYTHYKTIKLSYTIEGKEIEEIADGLISFTAFGSTGYFLSINGIYIDTDFKDLIGISFIAPHSLKSRPILLKNKEIIITNKDKKSAILLTDGQDKLILEPQKYISIKKTSKTFALLGNKNTFKRWAETFYE